MNHYTSSFQPQSYQSQPYTFPATSYTQTRTTSPPKSNRARPFGWSLYQQVQQQSVGSSRTQDDPYSCNFIGQLQGSYEIDGATGIDHLTVVVPETDETTHPYAIVRRVCDDGEALPDQFIYEEQVRFTLCNTDGKVDAMMRKGINMKRCIKWELMDGKEVIWRRTGKVNFNLVSVEALSSCSRRNSIASVYSTKSSILSNTIDNSKLDGIQRLIRPELRQNSESEALRGGSPLSMQCNALGFPTLNLARDENSDENPTNSAVRRMAQEEKLFEWIKANFMENPSLMKRVVR